MRHDASGGLAAGPTAPAGPIHEEPQPITNESLFPGFTPGPVVPAAANAAFGHHFAEPNMTPAPKKYDYSQDKSGPEAPPPESTRRLNDMLREPEQTMCESRERPPAPSRKPPIVYDPRNSSYQPPAPSLGQSAKNIVGKVWSGVQNVLGPSREEPAEAPPTAVTGTRS